MSEVNYIKHLNTVFFQFSKDKRLNPTHISLYMALFQLWNINRFPEDFFINREEVMQLSKIGSKSTYHRCLKELNHWSYVVYFPSHNPYRGSKIKMLKFSTTSKQVEEHNSTKNGISTKQALVPIYKHIQTIENNINAENEKNRKNGFQSDAEVHAGYDKQNRNACTERSRSIPNKDNLKISNDKNYNEPL